MWLGARHPARRLADRRPRRRGGGRPPRAHRALPAEAAALAGGAAAHDEALDGAWRSLLRRRWRLILRQLALNVALYSTDYMGSVVNYLAIAAAICAGMYDGLSPHDVVQIVSRGAGFAISLVYGFTQIVDCATQAMQLSGYTRRVAALARALDAADAEIFERSAAELASGKRILLDADGADGGGGGRARPPPCAAAHFARGRRAGGVGAGGGGDGRRRRGARRGRSSQTSRSGSSAAARCCSPAARASASRRCSG